MRTPLLAGNWKMHKTVRESLNLVEDLLAQINQVQDREILVCPPFTALYSVSQLLKDKNIKLGAQDVFWETEGAFTGEISPGMLKDIGCQYVIIGHSERRGYFQETDVAVNKKVKAIFGYGLKPIMCVGESLELREQGKTQSFVSEQVKKGLKEITSQEALNLVIAYEPIWAIGTGKTDTPPEANRTIGTIRQILTDLFGYQTGQKIRILYGGSVKPDNVDGFMVQPEIDGALVGGASLKADSFIRIVRYQ